MKKLKQILAKFKPKFQLINDEPGIIPSGDITYIVAFIVPFMVFVAAYCMKEIFPFGNNCYLRSDMYHQYAPFYSELWNKLRSGEALTYTWNVGLGNNFISLMAYYLASPINWIIALFPQRYMIEIMNALIILKMCSASVTFTYYISKHFNTKRCTIVLFSIFYAISGYVCAYSWNIMWLDCIVLLPLIILGLEQLVKEGRFLLYTISLGLCIFTNYYIAIMVCLTVIIYFFVLMITGKHKLTKEFFLEKFIRWAIFSCIAGGLAACLLLPELYTFSLSSSSNISFPKGWTSYFSFVAMISRHLMDVPVHLGLDHHPNIYCGVAVFFLIPLYAMDKEIKRNERIGKLIILFIFLTSFNLNIPNFIWHGFHFPNSLPARQGFIYIFFVLIMCYEAFSHIKRLSYKTLGNAFWIAVAFIVVAEELLKDNTTFDFNSFYLSGLFILIYALMMYLTKRINWKFPYLFVIGLTTVVVEATLNITDTGLGTTSRSAYLKDYDSVKEIVTELRAEDDSFYRVDKIYGSRSRNDGAWHNYPTISTFSSTCNGGMVKLYELLGLASSANSYGYDGSTMVTNSLFSVKYLISKNNLTTDNLFSYVDKNDNQYVFRNNYTLPIGYAFAGDIQETVKLHDMLNGIENQNALIGAMTGVNDVFEQIYQYDSITEITFSTYKSGHMYIYKPKNTADTVSVIVDGETCTASALKNNRRLIDGGYVDADSQVTISGDEAASYTVYILDEDKFMRVYNTLNDNGFKVDEWTTTSFTGTVTADYDGTFMFSIPYDGGWSLYIDGVKTETFAALDALLAAPITAGEHTVELKYTPVNYILGCIITICSIILLIVLSILRSRKLNQPALLTCAESEAETTDAETTDAANTDDISADNPGTTDSAVSSEAILEQMDDFDNILIDSDENITDTKDNENNNTNA